MQCDRGVEKEDFCSEAKPCGVILELPEAVDAGGRGNIHERHYLEPRRVGDGGGSTAQQGMARRWVVAPPRAKKNKTAFRVGHRASVVLAELINYQRA